MGCDLEKIGPFKEKVAGRFFCPEEYEVIMQERTEEEKAEQFTDFWVLKESFMKAYGNGDGPPDQFLLHPSGQSPTACPQTAGICGTLLLHGMTESKAIPCRMAVCSTDCEIDAGLSMEFKL